MWLLLLILINICICYSNLSEKTINVDLKANFKQSNQSIILETAEFYADQSNIKYWKYIDTLTTYDRIIESDKDQYDIVKEISEKIDLLSEITINYINLSLSTHYYAAHIETYHKLINDIPIDIKCKDLILYSQGKFSCFYKDLKDESKVYDNKISLNLYDFDHIYPQQSDNPNLPIIIVYADILSKTFKEQHSILKELAINGQIKYILRPMINNVRETYMKMQGYAVSLSIKNTEYKVLDDNDILLNDDPAELVSSTSYDIDHTDDIFNYMIKYDDLYDELDHEVYGIHFQTLINRYPNRKENLLKKRLKMLLQDDKKVEENGKDKGQEKQDAKEEEKRNLGMYIAQRLMKSNKPLELLTKIIHNLPIYASSLMKTKLEANFLNKYHHAKNPNQNLLQINNILIDIDTIDLYQLNHFLNQENFYIESLKSLSLSNKQISKLLHIAYTINDEKFMDENELEIRFDTTYRSKETIIYLNNLQTDEIYQNNPKFMKSTQQLYGMHDNKQLIHARFNFFNVIIYLDPTEEIGLEWIDNILGYYSSLVPIRFGISFLINKNKSSYSTTNAWDNHLEQDLYTEIKRNKIHYNQGQQQHTKADELLNKKIKNQIIIAKLFNHLHVHYNVVYAYQFLRILYSYQRFPITSKVISKSFKYIMKDLHTTAIDIAFIKDILKRKEHINFAGKMQIYTEQIGFNSQQGPYLIFNGLIRSNQDLAFSSFSMTLNSLLQKEQKRIIDGITLGKLNDETNYDQAFLLEYPSEKIKQYMGHIIDLIYKKPNLTTISSSSNSSHLSFFNSSSSIANFISYILVINFQAKNGITLAYQMLSKLSRNHKDYNLLRLTIIPNYNLKEITLIEQIYMTISQHPQPLELYLQFFY